MIFRSQEVKLKSEHVGSIPEEEVFARARKDLTALTTILGTNQYILGTKQATETDIDIYMWVGHLFFNHMYKDQAFCLEIKEEFPQLLGLTNKLRHEFFPELFA